MIAIPVIKADQSNIAPTESQLKLAISQVLSLPAAYNAPVIVLDFNVGDDGLVTGRFRDAARPRVFTYEIDDDGIAFKPFTPGRMDSLNVTIWESFSEGYTYRFDAVANKSKSRRQCVKPTAYNCGKSCININKTCRVNPKDATSSMRRKKLKAIAEEFKKANKGVTGSGGSSVTKPDQKDLDLVNDLTGATPSENQKTAQPKNKSTNKIKKEKADPGKPETTNSGRDSSKLIGDGTQESSPVNAQEYYEMMIKKGNNISKEEAEETIKSIKEWKEGSDVIRGDQQQGKPNKDADNIDKFIKNSTPYKGMIARGIVFNSREEVMNWIKGDENGILGNQGAHASWSSDFQVASDFAGVAYKTDPFWKEYSPYTYPVIIIAKNKTGVPIQKTGDGINDDDAEVIVSKNTRHRIVKVTDRDGVILVEAEEV